MIERRPRAPVLRSMALRDDVHRASSWKVSFDVLHLEQALILLDQRVLRLGEDLLERFLVEVLERRDDRQATADEFRDEAELQQILGSTCGTPRRCGARRATVGGEADRRRTLPRPEMIFSRPAKAPPQMNRMLVVSTCRNSCCGCLRPALAAARRRPCLP